jgi:adenylate kinase
MTRIVLLGAPGSGKGTQAQRLQAMFGIPQVSSGDLLRDAVARGTALGRKAKAAMDAGRLVSDDIVLGLIRERLARPDAARGFILDGFPRNSEQAEALERLLTSIGQPLDTVVLLDVERELLHKRLTGRRTCRTCGRVFNIYFSPPGTPPHCDRCDDKPELFQRPDDREDVIEKRLEVYEAQTRPLIEHYGRRSMLQVIKGEGPLEEVFARMQSILLGAGATVPLAAKRQAARKRAQGGTRASPKPKAPGQVKASSRVKPRSKSKAKAKAKTKAKTRTKTGKKTQIRARSKAATGAGAAIKKKARAKASTKSKGRKPSPGRPAARRKKPVRKK